MTGGWHGLHERLVALLDDKDKQILRLKQENEALKELLVSEMEAKKIDRTE